MEAGGREKEGRETIIRSVEGKPREDNHQQRVGRPEINMQLRECRITWGGKHNRHSCWFENATCSQMGSHERARHGSTNTTRNNNKAENARPQATNTLKTTALGVGASVRRCGEQPCWRAHIHMHWSMGGDWFACTNGLRFDQGCTNGSIPG